MSNQNTYINGPNGPRFLGPASFPIKQNLNNSLTQIKMGMPQKFGVSDGNANFSQGRKSFLTTPTCSSIIRGLGPFVSSIRVDSNTPNCSNILNNKGWSHTSMHTVNSRHTTRVLTAGKKSEVSSSDQYIQRKKNKAIGLGSTNIKSESFSFATNDKTNVTNRNQSLARCRSGGCVAPAKKGAIANQFKSGGGGYY